MKTAVALILSSSLGSLMFSPAPVPQAAPGNDGSFIMGIGGSDDNKRDLCWVLGTIDAQLTPRRRTVLALYGLTQNRELFELKDVRMIDADLRMLQLEPGRHAAGSRVQDVFRMLPEEERNALRPPEPGTEKND